jgi:hypothetical protein
MSIENGPIAERLPIISMRKNLLLPFMQHVNCKIMPAQKLPFNFFNPYLNAAAT